MSEHRFTLRPDETVIEGPTGLRDLVTARLRAPAEVRYEGDGSGAGDLVYVFGPDLTPEEATTFDALVRLARGSVTITLAEREALAPFLPVLRTVQQMSRAEWMALTDAERERRTFDTLSSLIRVVRALLRDG